MDMDILRRLNAPTAELRLAALRELAAGAAVPVACGRDVNNHIHTTFSFSPYSPTAAVWFAWQAGLMTCGIMDHDSVSGAEEFTGAGGIIGMGTTAGIECRVSFLNTPFAPRRINNPDQIGCVYMALHGIPHTQFERVTQFFEPYAAAREARNRKMVAKINRELAAYGQWMDYDRDVVPLSEKKNGGSVTERHISLALARLMARNLGHGKPLIYFIKHDLRKPLSPKVEANLLAADPKYVMYDLIGWIKSELVPEFYIDATDECPDVRDVLKLSEEIGAISAYAYLGDVEDSVTGDKRAQQFEDDYLDELFAYLKGLGFRAVTYMPSRNTRAQLQRVRALCGQLELLEISGEDINSPRQSFVCEAQRDPMFENLYEATWALIAHEWLATEDPQDGFFSRRSEEQWPELKARVSAFARMGQGMRFKR